MANYYLTFSDVLTRLTEQEEAWLRSQLEVVWVFGDQEYAEDDVPAELLAKEPDWTGCRAWRDMEGYNSECGEPVGFAYRFADDDGEWGRHLWFYTEEWGPRTGSGTW